MNKEELIIRKLLKVVANQQKILTKLAQTADPNIKYLTDAAQVASMNSGLNATHVTVTSTGGGSGQASTGTVIGQGYMVTVGGAPKNNQLRQKFMDTLKRQVATQKPDQPDLASNLSIIFSD